MPNKLKGLVSKKKIRFQKDGFDLDLTYITNRIIAMGYPAQSWEGIYRNHIDDVVSFFKKRHEGHYQIYNLCNERHIDEQKFEPRTINHSYSFDDHNPPRFSQMIKCCEGIHHYLDQDVDNIVAIQCKAGKGRTGVIVCSYLLLTGQCKNAASALQYYGLSRTTNGKGVTIPSQIRYIYYFDHFLRHDLTYTDTDLTFHHLVLEELPNVVGNGYEVQVIVYGYDKNNKMRQYHSSQFYEIKKDSQRSLKLGSQEDWMVSGDLKFQIVLKSKFGIKENLCHCWLNTFFVVNKPSIMYLNDKSSNHKVDIHYKSTQRSLSTPSERPERPKQTYMIALKDNLKPIIHKKVYKFTIQKHEIDKANKDVNSKVFPSNFAMTFFFEHPSSQPPVVTNRETYLNKAQHSSLTNLDFHGQSCKPHLILNHSISSHDHYMDNGYQRSESSESSTKDTPSDLEELSS